MPTEGDDMLRVTVVGTENFRVMEDVFNEVGLTIVDWKNGSLGNLKTRRYDFYLKNEEVVEKRKSLMNLINNCMRLTGMYVYGDWMRIYVFRHLVD